MKAWLAKYLFYYPVTLLKGENVLAYLNRYRKFQWCPSREITAYQEEKLRELIIRVAENNPYYRQSQEVFERALKEQALPDVLRALPTLTKQDLIQNIGLLGQKKNLLSSVKTTGGSTGEPVKLFKTASALARERAATWRAYEWAGVSIGSPQARFWGVPHDSKARMKARVVDFVSNRRRLSAFNITPQSLAEYHGELVNFQPEYLYGYVSAIDAFAIFIRENGLPPIPGLKAVITTSEVLSEGARKNMEAAFGVRVFNEYGCGEVGSIAHECEHGRMHVMADNLIVEIDAPYGESGEIVVTDLFNLATPLIRYRLGDFARFDAAPCPCGRQLPVIASIHGRAYDLVKLPSGKVMHPEAVIYVFEGIQQELGVFKQFQAIQESADKMRIKLVAPALSPAAASEILARLRRDISEDMEYELELCDAIARERSGKMRVVKSLI